MTDRLAELGALQYAVENLSTAGTNPNRLGLAGYIHAAYTDYQTWAAANPGVNPNRLSARGRLYGYFYDNASWSPTSLFANSEVGAWYDPSDLSTMFQDRAGTTPVTADGQTVGKILDKSGRGNHAVAPSDASRPLYKTDGTYHWLQFDGVDDSLSTAAINFTATNKMSLFSGFVKGSSSAWKYIFGNTSNSDSTVGSFGFYAPGGADTSIDLYGKGSLAIANKSIASAASGIKLTSTGKIDLSASVSINTNGGSFNTTSSNMGGNFANDIIIVGMRGDGSYKFKGNIYSLIVRGALSTTDEITNTETWVNSKTGAY